MAISCGDKLMISEAVEMRDSILRTFRHSANVMIDCSHATDIDLTFIQLLIASRRTARASGAKLRISAPLDSPIAETLRRAGFAPDDILADISSHGSPI
ncbi:STAS domain-containing protein [Methylosinus sp. Sm6]|nr:STAS domain-containing protein [Methylosinus sp. Sm6]